MPNDVETRLCERCWAAIPPRRPCLVAHHPDPSHPLLRTPRSFRHLRDDPSCTGSQEPTTPTEPGA
ncbi:hypothetical protein [Pseudonocardia spirodelae]|uniref:Uncharacterized protein n=1 Tax=Pseudonocardia spirodelae TaxID=3133431 RepID=A0ABU8T2H9_9PSEU